MKKAVIQIGHALSLEVCSLGYSATEDSKAFLSDFNFQPNDAAYALIVGDPLSTEQSATLAFSRVVHRSIDPDVPVTAPKAAEEENEGTGAAESDPDKIITNARPASSEDGLLSDEELQVLFQRSTRPVSAYDEGLRSGNPDIREGLTFHSRQSLPASQLGAFEPVWTSYTHVRVGLQRRCIIFSPLYSVLEDYPR